MPHFISISTTKQNEMIVEDTYKLLRARYPGKFECLEIEDVRIGVFHTAIKLSDGSFGVSSTFPGMELPCDKKHRDFGDFSPLKIKGQKVTGLFDTLKVSVLNAISSNFLTQSNYHVFEDTDPIDLIDLQTDKIITIIGAFHSYINRISETRNKLYVLELNESTLSSCEKEFYVPAKNYPDILPLSDIVIITGLTFVNNTIDSLLESIRPHTQTIVTGPTSSIIPDILFENHVNIVGAARITDPDLLFSLVGEAGAGFHLHEYCVKKICIINDKEA
jgi:uncharacterized protein (DUF4213/DUF364 family)